MAKGNGRGGAKASGSHRRSTQVDDIKMRRAARREAARRDGTLLAHRSAVFTNRLRDRSRNACRQPIDSSEFD